MFAAYVLLEIVVEVGRVETQRVEVRGSTHVTRSILRRDDGKTTTVEHLGGTLDGIGVLVVGQPTLRVGERVAIWREGPWLRARAGLEDHRREYVQARAQRSDAPLKWEGTDVSVVPNTASGDDVEPGEAQTAVQRAAANWNQAAQDCAYMTLAVESARSDVVPGFDRNGGSTNVVFWREDFWGADPETPYPPSAAGITTLRFFDEPGHEDSGRILDADIELNGVNFQFSTGDCDPKTGRLDLENTLTHEMGHLLGLDHTCHDGAVDPPLDDHGLPIPDCSSALPSEVREATMFSTARACETFMRTPEQDDIDGFCGIYPLGDPPAPGGDGDGCSCATAGRAPGTPWLGLLGWVLLSNLTARACSRYRTRSGCGAGSAGRPRSSCEA